MLMQLPVRLLMLNAAISNFLVFASRAAPQIRAWLSTKVASTLRLSVLPSLQDLPCTSPQARLIFTPRSAKLGIHAHGLHLTTDLLHGLKILVHGPDEVILAMQSPSSFSVLHPTHVNNEALFSLIQLPEIREYDYTVALLVLLASMESARLLIFVCDSGYGVLFRAVNCVFYDLAKSGIDDDRLLGL
jgi:hypothetical protein